MITLLIVADAALLGLQVEINPEVHYLLIQGARVADQVGKTVGDTKEMVLTPYRLFWWCLESKLY